DSGAGALWWGPDGGEPFRTTADDVRYVRQGLDVVHHGRFVIEAVRRRERWFEARQAAFAFNRLQQCRFFSADIGAGASVHPHIGGNSCAQDVCSDITGDPCFGNRLFQDLGPQNEFSSYINVGGLCSDCVAGEHDTFQQLVGISFDKLAVLERAWFAFVRVATEIARTLIVLGQKSPFHTGRKAGPAAPPETRLHHRHSDFGRRHFPYDLAECLVAACTLVFLERTGIAWLHHVLEQDQFVFRHLNLNSRGMKLSPHFLHLTPYCSPVP